MSMFTQGDDFYDMGYAKGFAAGQADANDMLTIAHMDGYAKGRDAMRAELARQEPSAWARFQDGEMTHMEMSDGSGADLNLPGAGFVPLYLRPMPSPDVRELVEALGKAKQLASIACDWNLDEVQIDDEMVRTRELEDMFDALVTKHREIQLVESNRGQS